MEQRRPQFNTYPLGSPEWKQAIIGEPVTRPDGKVVTLRCAIGGIHASLGQRGWVYTDEELSKLGGDNMNAGIIRVGRAIFEMPDEGQRVYKPLLEILYPDGHLPQ